MLLRNPNYSLIITRAHALACWSSKSIHGRSSALRRDESLSSCGFPPSVSMMKTPDAR